MELKDVIKKVRLSLRLSQAEFGRRVGVSESLVCRWEQGNRKPNYKNLRKIIKAFQLDPEIFFK